VAHVSTGGELLDLTDDLDAFASLVHRTPVSGAEGIRRQIGLEDDELMGGGLARVCTRGSEPYWSAVGAGRKKIRAFR
jgi:hypothetical protein